MSVTSPSTNGIGQWPFSIETGDRWWRVRKLGSASSVFRVQCTRGTLRPAQLPPLEEVGPRGPWNRSRVNGTNGENVQKPSNIHIYSAVSHKWENFRAQLASFDTRNKRLVATGLQNGGFRAWKQLDLIDFVEVINFYVLYLPLDLTFQPIYIVTKNE